MYDKRIKITFKNITALNIEIHILEIIIVYFLILTIKSFWISCHFCVMREVLR